MGPRGGQFLSQCQILSPFYPMGPNVLSHCLQKGGQLKSPLSILADGFVKITGHNKGPRPADGEGANTHGTTLLAPHSLLRKN